MAEEAVLRRQVEDVRLVDQRVDEQDRRAVPALHGTAIAVERGLVARPDHVFRRHPGRHVRAEGEDPKALLQRLQTPRRGQLARPAVRLRALRLGRLHRLGLLLGPGGPPRPGARRIRGGLLDRRGLGRGLLDARRLGRGAAGPPRPSPPGRPQRPPAGSRAGPAGRPGPTRRSPRPAPRARPRPGGRPRGACAPRRRSPPPRGARESRAAAPGRRACPAARRRCRTPRRPCARR